MNIDKLLIFDISGPFAHFKKYYTNASSLSYVVPPRTVIAGLIAGILGIPRDDYYNKFNIENTRIGISIKSQFRKIIQTVNYINTKTWNFTGNPQQVNLEILVPIDNNKKIVYRIYFTNKDYIDELTERIRNRKFKFNPYLGISEFLADIKYVDYLTDITPNKSVNNKIYISSCFKKAYIKELSFKNETNKNLQYLQYIIEKMPVNFKNNEKDKRNLYLFDDYIYEQKGKQIYTTLNNNVKYYTLNYNKTTENIIFME